MKHDRNEAGGQLLPAIDVEPDGNTVTLRLARCVCVSEGNCKAGRVHTAKLADVEAAIETLSRSRPAKNAETKRTVADQSASISRRENQWLIG